MSFMPERLAPAAYIFFQYFYWCSGNIFNGVYAKVFQLLFGLLTYTIYFFNCQWPEKFFFFSMWHF